MNLAENWLYDALIQNDCHTLVLKFWENIRDIIAMSTSRKIPDRDKVAQLQYKWNAIDINKTKKIVEITKDSKINFRDADKSERNIKIDLSITIHDFFERLNQEGYIFFVGRSPNLAENKDEIELLDGKIVTQKFNTTQELMSFLET